MRTLARAGALLAPPHCALAPAAAAEADPAGGSAPEPDRAPRPPDRARIAGLRRPHRGRPGGRRAAIQAAIAAANRINRKPYRYGGGHARFRDSGYDCSGTVSYVLHAAGVLRRPRASGDLMRFGAPRPGRGSPSTPTAATPTS